MQEIDVSGGILVAGYRYDVIMDGETEKHLKSDHCVGECDYENKRIQLARREDVDVSRTFLHECIHAANYHYNQRRLKEGDIEQISSGLHQIMEGLGVRFVFKPPSVPKDKTGG